MKIFHLVVFIGLNGLFIFIFLFPPQAFIIILLLVFTFRTRTLLDFQLSRFFLTHLIYMPSTSYGVTLHFVSSMHFACLRMRHNIEIYTHKIELSISHYIMYTNLPLCFVRMPCDDRRFLHHKYAENKR